MVNIDNVTCEIIGLLKKDYLFNIDYEEEQGLKSDISDILIKKEMIYYR